ncbi:serine aminopeptidase S33 family [Salsuginibacillus halophilus]|uniref:Serine aminopeptidase S33 family n=1 Tax=Salsuginibacillus halophilus TaxID=517424 RepID=A0A2P8HWJ8_9BACI|nr:alpha/beta fold hydrolase [Salsuginibacillus halophilus]PSL50568.1 serine aminopeptidase S33 family [Salsuginibacillus halophilus]
MAENFIVETTEGYKLHATLFLPETQENTVPLMILAYGFKGFKDWGMFPYIAEDLAELGFSVVTFNFSGNGISGHHDVYDELHKFAANTFHHEVLDIKHMIEAVQNKEIPEADKIDTNRIYLAGHSRGGASALLFQSMYEDLKVQGLILLNSVLNYRFLPETLYEELQATGASSVYNGRTKSDMPLHRPVLEDVLTLETGISLMDRLRRLQTSVFIIQGELDQAYFVERVEKLKRENLAHVDIAFIPRAGHTFETQHPFQGRTAEMNKVVTSITDWINEAEGY